MKRRRSQRAKRGGFLMLTTLVCVALVVAMAGLMARMFVVHSQYGRAQFRRMQCQWLVDSGIERAAARLAADAEFTGETWRIEPEELDGQNAALVHIDVASDPTKPEDWLITVQADYPAEQPTRVRQTRTVHLAQPKSNSLDEEES